MQKQSVSLTREDRAMQGPSKLVVKELRAELERRGLETKGTKAASRLVSAKLYSRTCRTVLRALARALTGPSGRSLGEAAGNRNGHRRARRRARAHTPPRVTAARDGQSPILSGSYHHHRF
eukprot:3558824-Rhodomonas_salina.1